jgi:hypothetical protein
MEAIVRMIDGQLIHGDAKMGEITVLMENASFESPMTIKRKIASIYLPYTSIYSVTVLMPEGENPQAE